MQDLHHNGMIALGFVQSDVDTMFVYYHKSVVLMICVDDGIFLGPNPTDVNKAYKLMVRAIYV
jgi:hypothetical protein